MRSSSNRGRLWLMLCGGVFAAAIVGAVVCGALLHETQDTARAEHLLRLIYLHFFLAQISLLAAGFFVHRAHRRWRRYYLIVSYNEKGMQLNPPGVVMPRQRVCRCHLHHIDPDLLPPADAPILVYPMFMLSGKSSGEKLEQRLRQAYAGYSRQPRLFYQPVLGASPWLAQAAAQFLSPLLVSGAGVLVVAHGSNLPEPPPEPALFCRRLRKLLPAGTELVLGYFNQQPDAKDMLRGMTCSRVLLLPFLLTEGVHTARDLPTPEDAAACGKTLQRLPVATALLHLSGTDNT